MRKVKIIRDARSFFGKMAFDSVPELVEKHKPEIVESIMTKG
jgi:hypothetical protein